MEVESKKGDPRSARRRFICLMSVIALIVTLALIILVLALTVFKPKRPVTTINSVTLRDFDLNLNILSRFSVSLNVTLEASITIKNPNKVGFKYSKSSAFVRYRGRTVAEAPIPAGKIGADKSTNMNLSIIVLGDRLLSSSELYTDIISGNLALTSSTRISGKVRIMFFNIHVVSSTSCDINVDVSSRSIRNQTCHYKTKF